MCLKNEVDDRLRRENRSASQNIVYVYKFPIINTGHPLFLFFRLKLLAVEIQLVGVLCHQPEGDETMNIVCYVPSSSLDSHWNIAHHFSLVPVLTSSTLKKAMRCSILLKVGDLPLYLQLHKLLFTLTLFMRDRTIRYTPCSSLLCMY